MTFDFWALERVLRAHFSLPQDELQISENAQVKFDNW